MSCSKLTGNAKRIAYSEEVANSISEGVERTIVSIDNLHLQNNQQKGSFLNAGSSIVDDLQHCLKEMRYIVINQRFRNSTNSKLVGSSQNIANLLLHLQLSLLDEDINKFKSEFKATLQKVAAESKIIVEVIKEKAPFDDIRKLVNTLDIILTTITKVERTTEFEQFTAQDINDLLEKTKSNKCTSLEQVDPKNPETLERLIEIIRVVVEQVADIQKHLDSEAEKYEGEPRNIILTCSSKLGTSFGHLTRTILRSGRDFDVLRAHIVAGIEYSHLPNKLMVTLFDYKCNDPALAENLKNIAIYIFCQIHGCASEFIRKVNNISS